MGANDFGFAFVLVALAIGLLIGTFVGAVILRAAISLYNKMAGGASAPAGVPEPPISKAMGITFVATLVNALAGLLIGFIIGGTAAAAGNRGNAVVTAQLACVPVGAVVMAGMLSAMLPTTFGRAFLVTLCHFLIVLVIVGTIVLVGVIAIR